MKKQQNNHKITPDVRNQISSLVESLPKVPYLMRKANGESSLQMTNTTNMITGQELIQAYKEMGKEIGDLKIKNEANYSYQQAKMRLINHKVELITRFQRDGQFGIDQYVEYVTTLYDIIQQAGKPKEGNETYMESRLNTTNDEVGVVKMELAEYPGTKEIQPEDIWNDKNVEAVQNFIGAHANGEEIMQISDPELEEMCSFKQSSNIELENKINSESDYKQKEPLLMRENFTSDKAYDDYLSIVVEYHKQGDFEYPNDPTEDELLQDAMETDDLLNEFDENNFEDHENKPE